MFPLCHCCAVYQRYSTRLWYLYSKALDLPQSCTKPVLWHGVIADHMHVITSLNSATFCQQKDDIDGLMQERHNSIADALELGLSCINPSSHDVNHYCASPNTDHTAAIWHIKKSVDEGNNHILSTMMFQISIFSFFLFFSILPWPFNYTENHTDQVWMIKCLHMS